MDALIQTLRDLVLNLRLWRVVSDGESGVRYRFGHAVQSLGTGLWLCLPMVHEIRVIDSHEQGIDIQPQSLTTRDGVVLYVESSIFYTILDPVRACVNVRDYDECLPDLAAGCLAEVIRTSDYDTARNLPLTAKKAVAKIRPKATSKWGLTITTLEIKSMAKSRVLRVRTG